jgi:hypothetical protein
MIGWFPNPVNLHLRQALPEPKRASKDFDRNNPQTLLGLTFSKLIKFMAKAAIPDADDSGTVRKRIFGINCKMIVFKTANRFLFAQKLLNFRFEIFFRLPFKSKSKKERTVVFLWQKFGNRCNYSR